MYILLVTLLYSCCCVQITGFLFTWRCSGAKDEFKCVGDAGQCTSNRVLCNGRKDCPSGFDERNCGPGNCTAKQFFCPEGFCTLRCNGMKHCADGSDEENCQQEKCQGDDFYCPKGFCRPKREKCNRQNDCGDWSDEENCPPANCRDYEFRCPKHQRICHPKSRLCDGDEDCPDSSDENCRPENCTAEQFYCQEGVCAGKCDNHDKDCADLSDEENCVPANCSAEQFFCPKGFCKLTSTRCNDVNDCLDGSDEENCGPENCTAEQLYCPKGFCKPKSKRCDGNNNCRDWSDEENCPPANCIDGKIPCTNHQRICHLKKYRCNGVSHCPDSSDETNCGPENCTSDQVYCPKGVCIPTYKRCNGRNDCDDWSDEEQCPPGNCRDDEFACPNHTRICRKKTELCDGVAHCPHSSDEKCPPANCTEDEFQCPNNPYICKPKELRCDGIKSCPDASDENNCGTVNCTAEQIYCPEGFCRNRCDGHKQCSDGSDEENCGPENCTAGHFYCRTGFCKKMHNWCDGSNECGDWSDEEMCPPAGCGYNAFPCPNHQRVCKLKKDLCNGQADCPDASDENNCPQAICKEDHFVCPNHQSICKPKKGLCDGKASCPDFSDEKNCPAANCSNDQFPCPNHQRICKLKKDACDGIADCPDAADENNCSPANCRDDQFRCSNNQHMCKPMTVVCDGRAECPDSSDEKNCRPENCTADQLYCPNGFCRPLSRRCDGENDCQDWSDEENCPLRGCTGSEFRCSNWRCIPRRKQCNGYNDCGDWSDELNCGSKSCEGWYIRCPDGRCIMGPYKCNGINDCGDWSDELRCDISWIGCDSGWHYHRGRCFKTIISEKDITWQEAQQQCHDTNSSLASVTGLNDEEFLVKVLPRSASTIYIGLQKDYKKAVGSFQSKFHWDDGSSLTYENWKTKQPDGGELEHCTVMIGVAGWKDIFCAEYTTRVFVCVRYEFRNSFGVLLPPVLTVKDSSVGHNWLKSCNSGELTSKYKFCDGYKDCRDGSDEEKCDVSCMDNQYLCGNGECVSLSFYCDGINDCGDNSDEKNCEMKRCSDDEWSCTNGQCIEESKRCDMRSDCYDETDEADCGDMCRGFSCFEGKCIPHSWVNDGEVDCDGYEREDETGAVSAKDAVCLYGADEYGKTSFQLPPGKGDCASFRCPDMYYKCQSGYCIPVMFVCDGKRDCPNGDDDIYCNRYVCHGHYRCQGQSFCIHPRQVCDGLRHCPMGDDERYCPQLCPQSCECDGRVIRCDQNFTLQTTIPSDVRKLNLSGVFIQNSSLDLSDLHYLTILDLSYCQLITIEGLLVNNTNVIYLDLSNNALQRVSGDSFSSLTGLKHLDLSNNILLTVRTGTFLELSPLQYLNLRNTSFGDLNDKSFTGLSSLVQLNITNSSIEKIEGKPFSRMKLLRYLDLDYNYIEQFSCCFLKHLESLQKMLTHSYQFCCDSMRPGSLTPDNCIATLSDAISSCKDLLGTGALKAILWIIVLFAMFGNIAVLAYRFKYDRASLKRSYGIFVTNLSISDCLLGVYMLIIGIADAVYRDRYVSEDYGWRHGQVCKFAGYLAVLSSEASCIFISLITLDRFLAIKYPFGDVKFTRRSTVSTVTITWIVAVVLGAVPLLPPLSHWELYSHNSVCLALPLSSDRKPGWQYSTCIFIGLNFILFVVIGIGQIVIYRELKAIPKVRGGGSNDAKVAKRLFLVVMTDFCCWVPVGVMGIMALHGIPINKEVFSWTAVTVLPVNSALNPILYTLPSMIETWRKSNRENNLAMTAKAALKETPLPNHPSVRNARRYVGKRTAGMETLGDVIRSPEISSDVKCELLGLIVIFIYDLRRQERNFEAFTDEDIFVSRRGEEITAVCLSMKPDDDRHWQVEDIVYLTQLLYDNVQKTKGLDTRKRTKGEKARCKKVCKRGKGGIPEKLQKRNRRDTRNDLHDRVPPVGDIVCISELLYESAQKKDRSDSDLQYKVPTRGASKPYQCQRRGTI